MKKRRNLSYVSILVVLILLSSIFVLEVSAAKLYGAKGKLTLLRVHALGSKYILPRQY